MSPKILKQHKETKDELQRVEQARLQHRLQTGQSSYADMQAAQGQEMLMRVRQTVQDQNVLRRCHGYNTRQRPSIHTGQNDHFWPGIFGAKISFHEFWSSKIKIFAPFWARKFKKNVWKFGAKIWKYAQNRLQNSKNTICGLNFL